MYKHAKGLGGDGKNECDVLSYHKDHIWKKSKDAGDQIYFLSDPESVTHALYLAVSAYIYVDARVSSCVFPLTR